MLATLVVLASCAVGPDFLRPPAPDTRGYTREPLLQTVAAATPGGEAQRFVDSLDIPGQWWTLFHSPPLNALVEQSLRANPNLQAAQAALRVAMEGVYAQRGAFFPALTGNFSGSRQRTAASLSPTPSSGAAFFNLYTAQVSISYAPDVWGLNRRTVESLEAQADLQRFQLEAAYLTLTANVVVAAVQEASLRGQITATLDIIKAETELRDLFRIQFAKGQAPEAAVVQQEAALAQAQATLPPLQKALAQQRDLLAALAGTLPSDEPQQHFELDTLSLPQDLPVTVPAKLIEQRPDVRQAEANLHAASAQVGVAIANRLPNVSLTASDGTTSTQIGRLFTPGNGFWSIAGSLTAPILDGGTLLHRERGARAAYDQAAALYRAAVVTAFQNVADSLRALQADAGALRAALAAERAAHQSLEITRRQVELGAANYLALLTAQQTYLQAVIALVQAKASRYADTAALFQALGGGWWNRSDVTPEALGSDDLVERFSGP